MVYDPIAIVIMSMFIGFVIGYGVCHEVEGRR